MTNPVPRSAIDLRLDGLSFEEIATALGVDCATAIELIQLALVFLPGLREVEKDAIMLLELQRLDALQFALFARLKTGDLDVINPTLEVMDRRARLLGLYSH